jgi:outer membrane protein OmpA-like peptidoglycan-associated protein
MFSRRRRGASAKEEAEKPFWISYSDLMTALMVLFLITMAVALMTVTQGLRNIDEQKRNREASISSCMNEIADLTRERVFNGVEVSGYSIKFGTLAEFPSGRNTLDQSQSLFVREFVPRVLTIAREKSCDRWLKRITVDGYASEGGSYLYNLNLSYQRAQRVLCVLLDSNVPGTLSMSDRRFIRKRFFPSGSSFNERKNKPEESRRVELTLEFRDIDAQDVRPPELPWDDDKRCPSDYS